MPCAQSLKALEFAAGLRRATFLPSAEWGEAIILGLEQSRLMVLIFSEHANASPQVRREVERAVAKELPIIPFRIQNTRFRRALEYGLSNTHWLDAFDPPLEKHIDLLNDVVRRLLASPTAMETYAQESRPPAQARRFGALAWVMLACILSLLGFGLYHFTHQTPESSAPPTPQQAAIEAKLEKFQLDNVIFDSLPLTEIIHVLRDESKAKDPDKKGLNFTMSGDFYDLSGTDPTTKLPLMGAESVQVKISVSDVSMADALKAIIAGANQPIGYYIEDYGVVFYPIVQPDSSTGKWWVLSAVIGTVVVIYLLNL